MGRRGHPAEFRRRALDLVAAGKPVREVARLLGVSVLGVSCAGYYAWRFRPPSARAVRHAWLTDVIREVHAASYGRYGAKRVYAELTLGRGIAVGHNAVAMLYAAGRDRRPQRRPQMTRAWLATAEDLVDRRFRRSRPNELWLTDSTEHPTREGKVYYAVVLDAFSRRVVGWSISHNDRRPDLQRARDGDRATRGKPRDRDSSRPRHAKRAQFTAWTFTDRAKKSGLLPSMGSIGDCYDNAMIEAFWSRRRWLDVARATRVPSVP